MAETREFDPETAPERPVRVYRRARVSSLIKELGGPKEAAKALRTVDTHLIAIEQGRRSVGDDLASKIEHYAGKPAGWLDTDPALDAGLGASMFSDLDAHEAQLITLFRLIRDPQKRLDLLQRANSIAAEGSATPSVANPFPGRRPETLPVDRGPVPLDVAVRRRP